MKYFIIFFIGIFSQPLLSQGLEEEIGFLYVKAEYLMETARYDEAINQFSQIISKDPSYKTALAQRSLAKFSLGKNASAKADIMNSIELKGVDYESLVLLGKIDAAIGNHEATINSLTTGLKISKRDKVLLYNRGLSYKALDMKSEACGDFQQAKAMGHTKAGSMSKSYCAGIVSTTKKPKKKTTTDSVLDRIKDVFDDALGTETTDDKSSDESTNSDSDVDDVEIGDDSRDTETANTENSSDYEEEEVIEEVIEEEPIDETVNEISVDEDLTLIIKNGIGSRSIITQPNILILSDEGGDVAIDVCINGRGRVESAELNQGESSLKGPSITSLALRKAKEFWFDKSDKEESCGTIIFQIKGN